MAHTYEQLLDATIEHLEALKSRGVRHVMVSPETLATLSRPATGKAPLSNPKPQGDKPAAPTPPLPPAIDDRQPAMVPTPAGQPTLLVVPGKTATTPSQPTYDFAAPEPDAGRSSPEKAAAFAALRERVLACVKCAHLASSRKNVVFGVGSIDARLMFVGEAPGADEDEQGEPFVGKAGQLLTRIIQATGLQRADVYIANILKCRPDTPGQSAGNRKPTSDEMNTCIPYLHEQIDLIRPKVIVALGGTAVEGLLGKSLGIMKLRGTWKTYRGTPLMPTYHPAYLLRNQAMSEKRKVWEDMLAVMEKLEMPISEKQRNYFLRG